MINDINLSPTDRQSGKRNRSYLQALKAVREEPNKSCTNDRNIMECQGDE